MLHFGIREHGMGAVLNGIALHGGTRPYGGTFLVFSDYMRPSVRLAALMKLPVTYVWTHDSIGLGEDGPTHQPVEHLAALRAIPGLDVVRPADANETAAAWATILEHTDRPAGLALTRQNVPTYPRGTDGFATTENVHKGAYTLLDTDGTPDVILIGTGSEVQLAVEASKTLAAEGIKARVVSMVSREWFDEQDDAYRDSVIPAGVRARVSVEAGIKLGWREIIGDAGRSVSLEHYGASADYQRLYTEFGITADAVVQAAKDSIAAAAELGGSGVPAGRAAGRAGRTGRLRCRPALNQPQQNISEGFGHDRSFERPRRRRRFHLARRPLPAAADQRQPGGTDPRPARQRGDHQPDDLRQGHFRRRARTPSRSSGWPPRASRPTRRSG